uniref:Phosphotriesterase-related protein n=1 Tax=Parascaris equorum TaxID=6256 RepID=A0A914S6R8_PAREQ
MEKFARTVLKDIVPEQLGVTDCHDHLIKNYGPEAYEHPDFVMLSHNATIKEMHEFINCGKKYGKRYGVNIVTMVTMDPPNVGRDVKRMLAIANELKGKANIIMATGFHKSAFYDKGPIVERNKNHKAGIIKVGTGYAAIDRLELKSIEIAARSSIMTGCPILVHTQLGTMAYEAAKHLIEFGANPKKIQLSHLNKNPDKYYYEKIIKELGVTLCFDGPDRVKYYPDSTLAENIKYLVDRGYQKNITLSLDAGRILYQKNYGIEKGFITLLGYIVMGRGAKDSLLGALKCVIGYILLTIGSGTLSAVAKPVFTAISKVGGSGQSFTGMSEKLVKNAVIAVDIAAVYGFCPNAVTFAFASGTIAQFLGTFVTIGLSMIPGLNIAVVIPLFITLFFNSGAIGPYANAAGGFKAVLIVPAIIGFIEIIVISLGL